MARDLKAAKLKLPAVIEDIDFRRQRGLDRAQVLSLADAHFVEHHQAIVIVGADRSRKDLRGLCARPWGHPPGALRPLPASPPTVRRDRHRPRRRSTGTRDGGLGAGERLVVDDFLLRPLQPDQAADVLEVIEDRAGLRSTIVTSQLPVEHWHEALGDATIADAVLDRLLREGAPHRASRRVAATCAGRRSDRSPIRGQDRPAGHLASAHEDRIGSASSLHIAPGGDETTATESPHRDCQGRT